MLAERNAEGHCVRTLAAVLCRQDALRLFEALVRDSIGKGSSSLVPLLACRGHAECCLLPSRILPDDSLHEVDALCQLAQERGSELEKSLLCSTDGYEKLSQVAKRHLRACAEGDLKEAMKTNFAVFQEASTGCTALIAAVAGERLEVVDYLIATRGLDLVRTPDNAGRYPLHYVYALMHANEDANSGSGAVADDCDGPTTPRLASLACSNVHMSMAKAIVACDPFSWSLEDSFGRKPIEMSQIQQMPEAKNMLWIGWMAGRDSVSA